MLGVEKLPNEDSESRDLPAYNYDPVESRELYSKVVSITYNSKAAFTINAIKSEIIEYLLGVFLVNVVKCTRSLHVSEHKIPSAATIEKPIQSIPSSGCRLQISNPDRTRKVG